MQGKHVPIESLSPILGLAQRAWQVGTTVRPSNFTIGRVQRPSLGGSSRDMLGRTPPAWVERHGERVSWRGSKG